MALLDDGTGSLVNIAFRRGDTYRREVYLYDSAGAAVTPTAARMVFKDGTTANPGTAVSGLTVTPTITTGKVTYELTPTNTRLFTADDDYCYSLEVDDSSSRVQTIHYGNVSVAGEITT
jgi:hypothetical protein